MTCKELRKNVNIRETFNDKIKIKNIPVNCINKFENLIENMCNEDPTKRFRLSECEYFLEVNKKTIINEDPDKEYWDEVMK